MNHVDYAVGARRRPVVVQYLLVVRRAYALNLGGA